MNMARLCIVHIMIATTLAGAVELTDYRKTYDGKMAAITDQSLASLSDLQAGYLRSLDNFRKAVQQEGDILKLKKVLDDISLFEKEKRIPEDDTDFDTLATLRKGYRERASAISQREASQTIHLMGEYDRALEELGRQLTRSGNVETAFQVAQDREELAAALAEVVKRAPQISTADAKTAPQQNNQPDRLVIVNTNHGGSNHYGSKRCNVLLRNGDKTVWSKRRIDLKWQAEAESRIELVLPTVPYTAVRVEITEWVANGGGLSEVELWRNGENIAPNASVHASASWSDLYAAQKVVDGIKTSAQMNVGYWVLPNNTPGWVDLDFANTDAEQDLKATR